MKVGCVDDDVGVELFIGFELNVVCGDVFDVIGDDVCFVGVDGVEEIVVGEKIEMLVLWIVGWCEVCFDVEVVG